MRDPTISGGYFRIRLPPPVVYRLTDIFAHYAGLLLRMRCGDHGIFCRRTAFAHAGGFPDVPIMEDVEFFRRLRRHGRVVHSKRRIAASPRRYEAVGPLRLTLAYGFIATLYLFGVPHVCAFPNLQNAHVAFRSREVDQSQFSRRASLVRAITLSDPIQ